MEQTETEQLWTITIPPTTSIDLLPDDCLRSIIVHISCVADRNAFSLVNRRFRAVEAKERENLFIGNGVHPITAALHKLCNRFSSLQRIHIDYSEWTSKMGPQMSDSSLQALTNACPCLKSLTLRFCCFLTDAGVANLSAAPNLRSLSLIFIPSLTGRGLLSIVSSCPLNSLHIESCSGIRSTEWLDFLGRNAGATDPEMTGSRSSEKIACGNKLEVHAGSRLCHLAVVKCRGIGQGDLAKLGAAWCWLESLHFEQNESPREFLVAPVRELERVMSRIPNIRSLRLVGCSKEGGKGLLQLLPRCVGLEELFLQDCGMVKKDVLLSLQNLVTSDIQ